jgi:hypothetical protein
MQTGHPARQTREGSRRNASLVYRATSGLRMAGRYHCISTRERARTRAGRTFRQKVAAPPPLFAKLRTLSGAAHTTILKIFTESMVLGKKRPHLGRCRRDREERTGIRGRTERETRAVPAQTGRQAASGRARPPARTVRIKSGNRKEIYENH